jgi:hypothetical protein
MKQIRLGSGSGFWGDGFDPAMEVLEKGQLDYLCFDFLAELTMALLQRQKLKNPNAGFIPDAVQFMKAMMPTARRQGTRLISNGGGVNPLAAGLQIQADARAQGLQGLKVGVVQGDDMLAQIDRLRADGVELKHMEEPGLDFDAIASRIVCANVYTDGGGVAQALDQGADVVITGRVSDNGLYVGAAMHAFGWRHVPQDADRIAAAITLGHVVECAAACTGGMSSRFDEMPNMGRVGFPIIELGEDACAVITKVPGSGGRVDSLTIKEHLVYEIADPSRYLMPDGVADFTTLQLQDLGSDRVRISGMTGKGPPQTLKLVIGYQDGWIGESMAFFPWPRAYDRALKARQTMLERFDRLGLKADQVQFDFVGLNMLHGPAAPAIDPQRANELPEVGLRCAVRTRSAEEADKVRRAAANLWIMGPGGTSFGTPMKPRPVVALWPTLIPRHYVTQSVTLLEA